jgi:2-polyprenyl-6-hydroxyphenyl methylase/3-demethylubiquinone-9 3-methyltransferase
MATAPRIELNARSTDAIDGRQLRAAAFQRVRLEYVERTLSRLRLDPAGCRALVVGSGRGDLARGLAQLGMEVTAVDPSTAATEMARQESTRAGVTIVHQTAEPESLSDPDGRYDIAYYADTFEITARLDEVVRQAGRVLRGGAVLFYDTVNATLLGRLIYLGVFQAIPMTRIMPPGRYSAGRLRPPATLVRTLAAQGLRNQDICAFKPKNPPDLIKAVLARRRGKVTDDEAGAMADFVLDPAGRPLVTYLGYARRDD